MDSESLLSGHPKDFEEQRENILRPHRLEEFIGQGKLKENLKVFMQAARGREEALDHVFISGPPGLGKTTLASIIAHEMGGDLKVTSAPALEKPKDLAGLLTTLAPGSVFFIDEIHRLKPAIEEMLYIAMEDFELDWIIGQGPAARTLRIPIPSFTLVGATTKPGRVSSPLVTRFGIQVRIPFYQEKELALILQRSAKILEVELSENVAIKMASSSRGTPRVANRILRRMRDFAQVKGEGLITEAILKDGLAQLEIDRYGLERQDRHILRSIIENYGGGPVGAETLAISIGEGIDSLEDFYEPYLIQRGFLQRTPRGRMATSLAYEHLGIPREDNREDQGTLF